MSIINDPYAQQQQQQQLAANCAGYLGAYPLTTSCWPPQPVVHEPRKLTIEAVDGGYVVAGQLQGKGTWRPVATSSHQLAKLLKQWSAQFEAKDWGAQFEAKAK